MPGIREERMNVTCPQCATVFRVDPAKVPERGVRARCSVCSSLIAVRRPPPAPPALPPEQSIVAVADAPVRPAVAAPVSPPPPPTVPMPSSPVVPPVAPSVPEVAPAAVPTPPSVPEPPPVPRSFGPAVGSSPVRSEAPAAPAPTFGPARDADAAPVGTPRSTGFSNPFLQRDTDPSVRARRLANSLASDLRSYYPEKRARGLAEGNLKALFAEEVRKSWEEYVAQVGEEYARSTPFFIQAMNEHLAEGRPVFG